MKVVIDSNVLIADFTLQSPNLTILLESSKSKKIDLYIPQVVLDEVLNKYEQQIQRIHSELLVQIKKYNKLSESSIVLPVNDKDTSLNIIAYKEKLLNTCVENRISIIDYPEVDHKFLAKKAMMSRKPFNSNEKGYRDNLIWENIKSIISEDNPDAISTPDLVFISGNYKDFLGNGNQLHDDLLMELSDANKSEDIVVYESLGEFNEKVSKLFYAEASRFKDKIENEDFWDFNLKSIIDEFLLNDFLGEELHNYREYTPYANDAPTINAVSEEYEITVTSIRHLSSTEFLIDVQFDLETYVTYFVDKYDYWSSEDDDYNVIDLEWNDYVVFVESEIILPLSVSIILTSELECKSIEINKIDEEYE